MRKKVLLVVECTTRYCWRDIFSGASLEDGTDVVVEQATWDEISVVSYGGGTGCMVTAKESCSPYTRPQRVFKPAFILMRSVTKGHWGQDSTNKLFTLMHAAIPSVNSLFSVYQCLQKPVIWGELRRIQDRLGQEAFPLIDQTMYPHFSTMVVTPDLPCVGKIGTYHASKGKSAIRTPEAFEDFRSVCAVQPAYVTMEPFIEWEWDGRIQFIGPHVRVFKRQTESWKGNLGRGAILEEIPLTPEFQVWADECRNLFGGLELGGLDFLCERETGKLFILELNDTAIGLVHANAKEDMGYMRDVVLAKWNSTNSESSPQKGGHTEGPVLREQVRRLILEKIDLEHRLQVALATKKKK